MGKIPLIIQREYLTRVKKKSFLWLSILGPLLIAGMMILVIWLGMAENENQKLIVVDDLNPAFAHLKTESTDQIKFVYMDLDLDAAGSRARGTLSYASSSCRTLPPLTISMGRSPGAMSSLSATMPICR